MMMMENSMMHTKKNKKMLKKIRFVLIWFQNKTFQNISLRLAEDKMLLLKMIRILSVKILRKYLILNILHNQIKLISKIIKNSTITNNKKLFSRKIKTKTQDLKVNKLKFKTNLWKRKKLKKFL